MENKFVASQGGPPAWIEPTGIPKTPNETELFPA
jgi:hypothetical protein